MFFSLEIRTSKFPLKYPSNTMTDINLSENSSLSLVISGKLAGLNWLNWMYKDNVNFFLYVIFVIGKLILSRSAGWNNIGCIESYCVINFVSSYHKGVVIKRLWCGVLLSNNFNFLFQWLNPLNCWYLSEN